MDRNFLAIEIVAENMCSILGIDSIKQIATDAYARNIPDTMPLIPVLAQKANNVYILTTYLLWACRIPHSAGVVVLANVGDQSYATLPEIIGDNELPLLVDICLTAIPPNQLKQLANEAYYNNAPEVMLLVENIADSNNDIHLRVVSLLWKYAIPFSLGKIILVTENSGREIFFSPGIENDRSADQLINQLCNSLSNEEIKLVVKKVYADNTINIRFAVQSLFKKTNNRYYKAMLLLWKYRIRIPNGLIILDRVDGYCQSNKARYYIDLCIYKDIYGAIRTGNSSYLKQKKEVA